MNSAEIEVSNSHRECQVKRCEGRLRLVLGTV